MAEYVNDLPRDAVWKIRRYIVRTRLPKSIWKKRDLSLRELLAMADYSDSRGVTDALALSFYYGQATCYRAVKGRFDGAGCEHRAYIR